MDTNLTKAGLLAITILYTVHISYAIGFYDLLVYYLLFAIVSCSWINYLNDKIKPTVFGCWTYICVILSIIIFDEYNPIMVGLYSLLVQSTIYRIWNKK